ncbi:F0F1 ATP synthase subunit delta [Nocardioides montaniterrae]
MDFRGASAEAVSALTGELTAAAGADAAKAASIAESLFTVADAVRDEPALRRFAADQSAPAEAKSGLVREVFAKLDGSAVDIVASAVQRRWTSGGNLARGLAHLAETATVLSAGDDKGKVADELFAARELVQGTPELRDALADPTRSQADKSGLVDTIFGGKVLPATSALIKRAVGGAHGTVSAGLGHYRGLAAEVGGETVATVRVARPLADGQLDRLVSSLSAQYGRKVHANVVIDPAVIGGVKVAIGDHIIDGTIATRLDDAKRRIAG